MVGVVGDCLRAAGAVCSDVLLSACGGAAVMVCGRILRSAASILAMVRRGLHLWLS